MRKVNLFIAMSLDGYIAREDGSVNWLFANEDYGYSRFYSSIGTIFIGRKTYEQALKFGENYNGKKVYVFTKKAVLKKLKNAELISEPESIAKKLKKSIGNGIWLVGGGEIVSIFLNSNLIDELILFVHPIILGKGIPLLKGIKSEVKLKLVRITAFKDGLVKLHYKSFKNK